MWPPVGSCSLSMGRYIDLTVFANCCHCTTGGYNPWNRLLPIQPPPHQRADAGTVCTCLCCPYRSDEGRWQRASCESLTLALDIEISAPRGAGSTSWRAR